MLPHARAGGISRFLEIVHDRGGREDLPRLAESLRLEVDDLLPTIDASGLLGFAKVEQGDVIITEIGDAFATADVHRSHEIFKEQLLKNVIKRARLRQVDVVAGQCDLTCSHETCLADRSCRGHHDCRFVAGIEVREDRRVDSDYVTAIHRARRRSGNKS